MVHLEHHKRYYLDLNLHVKAKPIILTSKEVLSCNALITGMPGQAIGGKVTIN